MNTKQPGRHAVRALAVTGVALASVASLVMSQTPAMADPSITYLAVGDGTTQNLMDAFSVDEAGNLLTSFDAFNPTSTITNQVTGEVITAQKTGTGITGPVAGSDVTADYANPRYCTFNRPSDTLPDGMGVDALRESMGSTNPALLPEPGETVTVTGFNSSNQLDTVTASLPRIAPQSACVDIARSSLPPIASVVDMGAGNLIYIPFALDAMAVSVGSNGNLASLATGGTGLSLSQLEAMYIDGLGQIVGTTCYEPKNGTACTGTFSTTVMVDLYVPQPGSAGRNFWLATMGIPGSLPAWVFDHIQAGPDTGLPVAENDGAAVSTDPNGLGPFSVAQWISQQKTGFGHTNFAAQAVLLPMATSVGPVAPYTGSVSAGTATVNKAFPVIREVYNVLQYDRVVNIGDGAFDPTLAVLFVGGNSALCQDAGTIAAYGFALLPSTAGTSNSCGQIDTTHLRAYGPTTGF